MYKGLQIVCIIPARGGSKGLPGKNIMRLRGKPLIAYSIEQARRCRLIDTVIVSTDDLGIARIARRYGAEVPFVRPAKLATARSSTVSVLLHALSWLQANRGRRYDLVVLLHATAPLRTVKDIENCIRKLVKEKADNLFSVCPAQRNPYFNMVEIDRKGHARLVKASGAVSRQTAPAVYEMNASIYVWKEKSLRLHGALFLPQTVVYLMPRERSIDIDDKLDFKVAEILSGGVLR